MLAAVYGARSRSRSLTGAAIILGALIAVVLTRHGNGRAPGHVLRDPTGSAVAALGQLPVKGRAPLSGYSRDRFGPPWTDDVDVRDGHNGCDTRDDVLRRDLRNLVLKPRSRGCVVLSGVLTDPYTGKVIDFARGPSSSEAVQIDHVVALADAWQTGAQRASQRTRTDLANDPLDLLAVAGAINQAKGAGDAATWLPPRKAYRCAYAARQIAVKTKYHLWVTPAERDALRRVLGRCPRQPLPAG